jgi:GT2 family glycosyltransferase
VTPEPALAQGKESRPLVSVIVGTRNRAQLLPRAVDSIAAQTLANFECIVVDDGSDAGTLAAYERTLAKLGPRFRLHRTLPPDSAGTGPGSVRNRGLAVAAGGFVAFLDDDDWWIASDHLQVAVEALSTCGADYFFSNRQGLRDGVVLISDWYDRFPCLMNGALVRREPRVFEVSAHDFCQAMAYRPPNTGNLVMSRALVTAVGGFIERSYWGEDFEYCVRAADRAAKILYRPDVTTAARLPEGNSVSLSQSVFLQQLEMIRMGQHLRARCINAEFRKCARAREAWTLRELAQGPTARSSSYRLSVAWQALCLHPTLGAALLVLRCLKVAMIERLSGRPEQST